MTLNTRLSLGAATVIGLGFLLGWCAGAFGPVPLHAEHPGEAAGSKAMGAGHPVERAAHPRAGALPEGVAFMRGSAGMAQGTVRASEPAANEKGVALQSR